MSDLSQLAPAETSATDAQASAVAEKPASSKRAAKSGDTDLGLRFDDSTPGVQKVHMSRNDMICTLFHTKDAAQANSLLSHCLKTVRTDEGGDGKIDDRGFMVTVVRDLAPRDVVERLLAVQMATTHVAVIRAARRMAGADHLTQLEAHTTAHTKLSRTFLAQMEALKRHRSKGQQVVRVERVTVEAGAQAVVGQVTHGGGVDAES